MQLQPQVFIERYNDESGEDKVRRGFKPHRNKDDEYIIERRVEVEPGTWNHGVALKFRIVEVYQKKNAGGKAERRLGEEVWYYDRLHDYHYTAKNEAQIRLMQALASGDLRGKYAEDIARELYLELFVADPDEDSPMRTYLPDVVKFWEHFWKTGGINHQA